MSEVMLRSHAELYSKLNDVEYEDCYQKLNSGFLTEFNILMKERNERENGNNR